MADQAEPERQPEPYRWEGAVDSRMEVVHPRLGKRLNGQDPLLAESLCFMSSCPICHKRLLWLGDRGMKLQVKNKLGQTHLHRRKHPLLTTVCQRLFLARKPCRALNEISHVGSQS